MNDHPIGDKSLRTILLSAFALSGAAALVYEVVWTRSLALTLGSTTYAVSTMLATFMGGLALGAIWGGRRADRGGDLLGAFAFCELGIGIAGMLSVPVIYHLPALYLWAYRTFHLNPAAFFAAQIALCALVMIVPTTLMGATFPLVSRALTDTLDDMGRKVASAYSWNTVGAMTGSLAAGFLLIPLAGLKGAALTAGALNLVVGLGIWLVARKRASVALIAVLAVWSAAALMAAGAHRSPALVSFYSSHRYLDGEPFHRIATMDAAALTPLYDRDTEEGTVRAFRTHDGHLLLQVGGKIEGTSAKDLTNTLLLAYLPIASHPAPRSMLVVGLGAGVTLGAARGKLDRVDLAEINPGVLEVNERFGQPGLLGGVRVFRNDARNVLLATDETWDLISSEPSYPAESGVSNLFTVEYYELAASRLSPGGLYCQWLPYHMLTNDDVDLMIRTFARVFPHAMLWKVPDGLDLILVGGREPLRVTERDVRDRIAAMNDSGHALDYILSRTPDQLAPFATEAGPLNTDDRPLLEFRVARNLRVGNLALLETPAPVHPPK